jgi:hypothetical protein
VALYLVRHGRPILDPDLERWRTLAMPDVITVEKTTLLEPGPARLSRGHV